MPAWWLIASTDLGNSFQSYTRGSGSPVGATWIVGTLLAVVALFVVTCCWGRIRCMIVGEPSADELLFGELCELHRLTKGERELLSQVADDAAVPQPAYLFLDRSVLSGYADRNRAQTDSCSRLVRKLFGDKSK